MPAASPEASDWCVTPSQKEEKSSSAYGLAAMNDAIAPTPTTTSPRTAPLRPPATNCTAVAATIGASTIPPVYFVAQARPRPSPAQT